MLYLRLVVVSVKVIVFSVRVVVSVKVRVVFSVKISVVFKVRVTLSPSIQWRGIGGYFF